MSIATWEFESPPLHSFIQVAEIAQLVEHNLAKVGVAGPSPVFRSIFICRLSFLSLFLSGNMSQLLLLEKQNT